MVPYFIDQCALDSNNCDKLNQYKDYCFTSTIQNGVLAAKDTSQLNFDVDWSNAVAANMTLDATILYNKVYKGTSGVEYDTKTRTLWKDSTAAGNTATPTAWVNGAKITTFPMTVDGWMTILNSVLSSQVT